MSEKQFSSVYLNDAMFGIDILLIREINRNLELTTVNRAPDYVRGLLNLRGQIVTVLDLGARLGLGRREITDSSRIEILKTSSEILSTEERSDGATDDVVGLLVDRVGDVISVESGAVEQPPANVNDVDGQFITGVVKLQEDLMVTLNVGEILKIDNN